MWIALLLLGCKTEGTIEDTLDPAPYIYDEDEEATPDLEIGELEAAMQTFIDGLYGFNARPVLAAYESVLASQDPYCPPWYPGEDGSVYWFGQCTSTEGTAFSGYGFSLSYDDLEQGGYLVDAEALFGVSTIQTGEGDIFTAGGQTYWQDAYWDVPGEEHMLYITAVQGTFGWTGDSADGTWLADAVSPDLVITVYDSDIFDGRYVVVDGGVSGLIGDADTVVVDELLVYAENIGSTCEDEPSGVMSVRGNDGNWFDVIFDGPDDANPITDPGDCDGCGAVYWRGEYLDDACADFSGLLERGGAPW